MRSIPDIPQVFHRFPDGYINDINGWAFDQETVQSECGKLLTLDIDFGSYCSLSCPHCFQSNSNFHADRRKKMTFDQMKDLVLQAKALGLRSVKFLGEGEPFQTVSFLAFLRFLGEQEITPLIFTHGHVIGDDTEVTRWNKVYGIRTGEELVKEVYKTGASVMLGFNALDDEIQAKMVGRNLNYIPIRNRALQLLVAAGFNEGNPTRLALSVNPIENQNIDDALEIYKWARLRNMYVVITPNMISGRGREVWRRETPSNERLEELYLSIYKFNIRTGLQTIQQITREGISPYAGGHPCNQVATGLYIKLDGSVWICPGSDSSSTFEGNVMESPLEEIWRGSRNFRRAGTFNNGCVAKDGKSIPRGFYDRVITRLRDGEGADAAKSEHHLAKL